MLSSKFTRHPRLILIVVGALAVSSLVGYGLASGAGNAPPPTTIPNPSGSVAPPPGVQTTVPPVALGQPLAPQGPPMVSTTATAACTSNEVSATFDGEGPYDNEQGEAQQIIGFSSTVPCYVSGYAQLNFASQSGSTVATTVTDGGYIGQAFDVSNVTISPVDAGSFLFQYAQTEDGATAACPLETALTIQIPNQSLSVTVDLKGVALLACGAINESPFIQGNSIDRYVS